MWIIKNKILNWGNKTLHSHQPVQRRTSRIVYRLSESSNVHILICSSDVSDQCLCYFCGFRALLMFTSEDRSVKSKKVMIWRYIALGPRDFPSLWILDSCPDFWETMDPGCWLWDIITLLACFWWNHKHVSVEPKRKKNQFHLRYKLLPICMLENSNYYLTL